jgi:hypothetical protein
MNFKTWWYDTKSTKWQIIIGTLLIGFVFIGTFAFLDTYQFEEWEYSGFAKSMIGILMGTVALGVITGVIIIFQSIVSMDREKNQKIFDERLALYKDFTKKTMSIVSDSEVDDKEREELEIIEKQVLMISSPETYKKWFDLYQEILKLVNNLSDEEKSKTLELISDKSIEFINSCRLDLEIGVIDAKTIEYSKKENKKILKNRAIWEIIQAEFEKLDKDIVLRKELSSIILDTYSYVKKTTLSAQISMQVINKRARTNYYGLNEEMICGDGKYDYLFENEDKTLCRYNKEKHGVWEIYRREDNKLDVRLV